MTTDDSRMDIVAGGFDAGIHFGEYIEKDMIAVRVSPDHRPAIVGSPEYFESRPKPKSPRDLLTASVHQLSARLGRFVPVGVREGQEVPVGRR